MRIRHSAAAGTAVLALIGTLAGCGGDDGSNSPWAKTESVSASASPGTSLDDPVAAAKKEGTLTVFTATDQAEVKEWSAGFTKKYGVKVKIFRQSSAEIGTTFRTQVTTHKVQADIFSTGNLDDIQAFADNGSLARFTPSTAGEFPAEDTLPGYAYPLFQAVPTVGWNTKTVPARVQKELEADPYKGLLDPALKGKIMVIDPAAGGSGLAIYANLVKNYAGEYGWDYLEKLAAQKPSVQSSIMAMAQQVTAGTYSATVFATESQWGKLADDGAPVKFGALDTMSASQFYQAVPAAAPHPAAARLYQQYMMTTEAQEAVSEASGGTSVMDGWTDNRSFVKDLTWYTGPTTAWVGWQTDPEFTGDNRKTFTEKWDQVFGVSR